MDKIVDIRFWDEGDGHIGVSFLVDIERIERGYISNTNISQEPYIMCNIITDYINEEVKDLDIDNPNYIFYTLYKDLKAKSKKKVKKELGESFKVVWENRKELIQLIKDLKNKYPELKRKTSLL